MIRGRARQLNVRAEATQYDIKELADARSAIAVGIQVYAEGRYEDALEIFEAALSKPGTGVKRFRDKPAEISPGERAAALYNCACCHSRMENVRPGLVAIAGALESGFEGFKELRTDPDLQYLRDADPEKFEGLVGRFDPGTAKPGLFGAVLYQLDPRNSRIYKKSTGQD
ncbi:unnamed protein product [Pedinophyceae sp. YPF-701]|nr:unnamed protein product [Pedinophyceae sp. YPF-701]